LEPRRHRPAASTRTSRAVPHPAQAVRAVPPFRATRGPGALDGRLRWLREGGLFVTSRILCIPQTSLWRLSLTPCRTAAKETLAQFFLRPRQTAHHRAQLQIQLFCDFLVRCILEIKHRDDQPSVLGQRTERLLELLLV